ncbi:hypothetical protein QUF75_17435 [Desulfococcaceae bacterium HSG7]|nr:hypothetical protein [Desulfococcaceae bacterium HSG7]
MMSQLRSVQVAEVLATIGDQTGLKSLINFIDDWNASSMPVSKIREQETKEDAAWRIATNEKELGLPRNMEKPRYLGHVKLNQKSERFQEVTEYNYHVFHLALSADMADFFKGKEGFQWVTWPQLTGVEYSPDITLSPTVGPCIVQAYFERCARRPAYAVVAITVLDQINL